MCYFCDTLPLNPLNNSHTSFLWHNLALWKINFQNDLLSFHCSNPCFCRGRWGRESRASGLEAQDSKSTVHRPLFTTPYCRLCLLCIAELKVCICHGWAVPNELCQYLVNAATAQWVQQDFNVISSQFKLAAYCIYPIFISYNMHA